MTAFDDLPLFRATDPDTSRDGVTDLNVRKSSQLFALLEAYEAANRNYREGRFSEDGLIDEEAGYITGLAQRGAGYWKRCAELRAHGLIVPTGATRTAQSGSDQRVCVITAAGKAKVVEVRERARNAGKRPL